MLTSTLSPFSQSGRAAPHSSSHLLLMRLLLAAALALSLAACGGRDALSDTQATATSGGAEAVLDLDVDTSTDTSLDAAVDAIMAASYADNTQSAAPETTYRVRGAQGGQAGTGSFGGFAAAQQQALPLQVTQALAAAHVPEGAVAMLVAPLPAAGEPLAPLLAWRADASMLPASVMKLVTTYAGLDTLGPSHLWRTRIYTQGRVVDGVLHGNLVIRGSGDPKLVIERLADLLASVQAKGVRHITGDIVLDRSIFKLPAHNAAAFDGEALRPYNVGPDGLLLNFKAMELELVPHANGLIYVTDKAPLAGVAVPETVPAARGGCGDWKTRLGAHFDGPGQLSFGGGFSPSCGAKTLTLAYADPDSFAPRMIEQAWRAAGGQLGGSVHWVNGGTLKGLRPLVTGISLPLASIITDINQFSNNVMAQQLFLTLSAQGGKRGSFAASRSFVGQWWQRHFGADAAAPVMENGSGLSRRERISAASLVALLAHAAHSPHAQTFANSLSVAGVSGTAKTMKTRSPGSVALGRVQMKTGTLRDVVAVAGYAHGMSGRTYAVAGIVNHANAGSARPALDRLLEWAVMQ